MSFIEVCPRGVLKQFKSLNPSKSKRPGGIPPRVLKEMADVLATPLTNLFQCPWIKDLSPMIGKKPMSQLCVYKKRGEVFGIKLTRSELDMC